MPWLGGQLRFLATYSYYSLFKIEKKKKLGAGLPPEGHRDSFPWEPVLSICLWEPTSKDQPRAMALGPCYALVDSLL